MISPLQQPTATVSLEQQAPTSRHSTDIDFTFDTTAVDGPTIDKCGSTIGACLAHMAPADLAATHVVSTSVVVEQPSHQPRSSQPAVAAFRGSSSDDAMPAALQLAGKQQQQQHMPPLVAAAEIDPAALAPALAEQAPVINAAAGPGHQPAQQHAQQQQHEQSSSEDDSWTPGQPQSSGGDAHVADADLDDEETWNPNGPPPHYCTNCTARLYQPPTCSDCGHSSEQDGSLFDPVSSADSVAGASVALNRPLIIWDDAMLLHEEGKAVPHPERPDRLRAIMARLVGDGVAGAALTKVGAAECTCTEERCTASS
eukprot:GHRQ01017804.1.p1 GENE.GHRQ01017804.1~~GHRQ01017804.1.p1  ORF type:complete len:313 (-),score=92.75 GHRQ01017804.1:197-1135(-)